jgi:hypothetical protein
MWWEGCDNYDDEKEIEELVHQSTDNAGEEDDDFIDGDDMDVDQSMSSSIELSY